MRTDTPPPVKLSDYRPYPFAIEHVDLVFTLDPKTTRVKSTVKGRRVSGEHSALKLDGEALHLISIAVNGKPLSPEQYEIVEGGMEVHLPSDEFEIAIETEIAPADNTALSGLYMSAGRFCTQCEAEGFRRITFFPDRPDLLAKYDVRIEAPKEEYPYLLSNGNPGKTGGLDNGWHFAEWSDPHPKPSYLFALVAGKFDVYSDSFTTRSGKDTPLKIYVDPGDSDRAVYAMDSLKRAMSWDEDVFGREYDLDIFNIVAVRDFNFGAMENKGLNIFNSAYVLADGETATDADFEAIESIVAHEYFHNWTGNRITCRDWFQLCLKEGLTVYRDQEFSADMRSRAVTRIKDVIRLRSRQFAEDAGPLAHPVRPDQYARIDNLYTATVYEKGAELIRMLRALLGDTAFFAGLNRYFDKFDGQAATIEDFISAFQFSTEEDLQAFSKWYAQPGTPHVEASGEYDSVARTYALKLKQHVPNGVANKASLSPLPIPILSALFSPNGQVMNVSLDNIEGTEHVLVLRDTEQTFIFSNVHSAPIHSLNRGFSAPIRLNDGLNDANRSVLAACDTDAFSQWEGLQTLARGVMLDHANTGEQDGRAAAFVDALDMAITGAIDEPAYAALLLRMPTVGELVLDMETPDPTALHEARKDLKSALARKMQAHLEAIADTDVGPVDGVFDPSADAAGKRALKAAAIDLLSTLGESQTERIMSSFNEAQTMTLKLASLNALANVSGDNFDKALRAFEDRWYDHPIVMDKWYSVQAMAVRDDIRTRLESLKQRADFDWKNPNRVRALAAAFAVNNPTCFHAPDGWGYAFLADIVLKVDGLNPALSARLCTAFESWRRFSTERRKHAEAQLRRLDEANLSKNAQDIITRALAFSGS